RRKESDVMRDDVLHWLEGRPTGKRPSKESLNHPGILSLVSGRDPFTETPGAFLRAYEALGIDIINMIPQENAPPQVEPGKVVWKHGGRVQESYLGVYNTTSRVTFPFSTVEEFWNADVASLRYDDLDLPGAQYLMPCTPAAIDCKDSLAGRVGVYYYQLYTTLFMWAVEALGWEVFMLAAATEPERFDKHFLRPMFEKTKRFVTMLSKLDTPWVWCHDDIAMATGPIFGPDWYDAYIFPRYRELWKIPHAHGKKVFFVADGKLDWALEPLRESGCDGIMFESPATCLEAVTDIWGDALFVGGIDAHVLTGGDPEGVRCHVTDVCRKACDYRGFALCCSGGLVGNMPLRNVEAYFDARAEYGYTRADWRTCAR
ncbi:MAG: uroporphyrinogen decarboxylase family protein, partial [Candidatus Pacebacteria bacterium]|nr:uroporphyrinogen decarboxylase family protein [Candidatus Paceibacterota bacterium]